MENKVETNSDKLKAIPRCVHSMHFGIARYRLENELKQRVNDKYCVHIEDYENINDLVRRSIITKGKITPESNPLAYYDSDEDIAKQFPEYETAEARPEKEQAKDEHSEVEASSTSGSDEVK